MTLREFRARFFDPEKWVTTGLTWAVLTTVLLIGWDLVRDGQVAGKTWTFGLAAVIVGAPLFGLLFRFVSRKASDHAR